MAWWWEPYVPDGVRRWTFAALVISPAITGFLFKVSRYDGWYPNSPSASLFFSDLLKLVVFLAMLGWNAQSSSADGYQLVQGAHGSSAGQGKLGHGGASQRRLHSSGALERVASFLRGERVSGQRLKLFYIALFQVVVNNSAFAAFQVADPGTAQLFKCCVPFLAFAVTASVRRHYSSRPLTLGAITIVLGLSCTQYASGGSLYSTTAYFVLFIHGLLAETEVECEIALMADEDRISLHARNAFISAVSATMNLGLHIAMRFANSEEPGFLDGYWQPGVVFIVFGNALAGLAGSLSHDASLTHRLIAGAPAVVFLLYCSETLFNTPFGPLSGIGVILVAAGSIKSLLMFPNDRDAFVPLSAGRVAGTIQGTRSALLVLAVAVSIASTVWLRFMGISYSIPVPANPFSVDMCISPPTSQIPPFEHTGYPPELLGGLNSSDLPSNPAFASPFKSTLAMIRWNDRRMERVPLLMKYAPFFHTVHISMPNMIPENPPTFHNLTHDQYPDGERVYIQLARTMQLLLDKYPDVDGLMYFHFDAWIDPLAWGGSNLNNILFLSGLNSHLLETKDGTLRFTCMTDTSAYPRWWGWQRKWHLKALQALKTLKTYYLGYKVREDEWCLGWSDIYYIPRRFFADYIFLSHIFGCKDVFHEVAVPTMLHIIDQSRRRSPFRSVIDRIGDCWGGCCDSSAGAEDVLWSRCGHRLNYLDQTLVDAHYGKLDKQAEVLGQPMFD